MAAALAVVLVLGLLLAGLLQARADRSQPALLRYQAWQLLLGALLFAGVGAKLLLGGWMPSPSGPFVKIVPIVLVLLLALALLLRRRAAAARADDVDF